MRLAAGPIIVRREERVILQILGQILFFLQRVFESTRRPGIPYTTHYLPKDRALLS